MKLLVHICCGPCSIYPLRQVVGDRMEVWGFFYNPNIHPYTEYCKRLEAVRVLAEKMDLKVIYRDEYDLEGFIRNTINDVDGRCRYCYMSRLEATAEAARKEGFDYFSSSLLYSRYQDHDSVKRMGRSIGKKIGVDFLYEDFRAGWRDGIRESKEMGLYRQQYCGCIFSEKERYLGKGGGKKAAGDI